MFVFDSSPLTPVVVGQTGRSWTRRSLLWSYLARNGGRTLESYRADLRQFLQWCHEVDVVPLVATRTHIELYRTWMDERGLAASTVDRRLSTVCGYCRFAHTDLMTGESASAGPVRPAGDVDPNSVVAFGAEDFPDTADDWSDPSTDVTFADDFSVAQEDTSFAPEPELDVEMPGDVDIASDFDVVA